MTPLVLALCLAAEPSPESRLLASEVTAGVGLLGTGSSFARGRLGEAQLAPVVTARRLFGGFTALSLTGAARAGWTGQRQARSMSVRPKSSPL